MGYLHKNGILHRDLKPENVMITEIISPKDKKKIPIIKLVDFGMATFIGPNQKYIESMGTLNYAAPEILTGRPYNHKVDTYSLGVILYEMIVKSAPLVSQDQIELMEMIICVKPKFSRKQFDKYSGKVRDLLEKLLIKEPRERLGASEALNHPWFD